MAAGDIEGFQKKYLSIEYEFLIRDYTEIENWIAIGRIDCGFLRLPICPEYETIFIKEDPFRAVLEKENMTEKYKDKTKYLTAGVQHDADENNCFKIKSLEDQKFLMLEKEENTEISDILKTYGVHPDIRVTTWDDYAIMSMVERKIGSAILPDLILKRIPYDVEVRPLDVPACRKIGLAYKSKETCSAAMHRFLEYIKCEMLPVL
nr:LysR family transcriptional regulator substrate-binding protein [uncultured Dorea sp.]